jgi:type II secretory pathway pseudopilin PulG
MKKLSSQKGQTLIEMMIALSIVVLVLLALITLITVSLRNASFSKNHSLATQYAQEALEEVRALRDQEGWEDFEDACDENFSSLLTPLPSMFNRTIDCEGSVNSKTVTATVSWTDGTGTHNSVLTTHFTQWK